MGNKIEQTLSLAQLQAMLEELKALAAKPTLAQIQAVAKRYGVEVSLMGAKTFRDQTFADHLARLASGREKAEAILKAAGGGAHPLDAIEDSAATDILDAYTAGREVDIERVVKSALNLRSSISMREDSKRKQLETEAKLRESNAKVELAEKNRDIAEERVAKFVREREEWERKQRAVAEQLERARNASDADADAIRANVVETIDSIMGLRK